jgi:hypothetical protein
MAPLPPSQWVMMAVSLVALIAIGPRSPEERMAGLVVGGERGIAGKSGGNGRWLFALPLAICCFLGNLRVFLGALAICGTVQLLAYGNGDTRYVAKKFAAYHFFTLTLCLCAHAIEKSDGSGPTIAVLRALALAVLLPVYPFNGWCDVLFIRAPTAVVTPWLVVVRPIATGFLLPNISTIHVRGLAVISTVVVCGSLYFVPVLFFARSGLRRLWARMACWQGGYIWLFACNPSTGHDSNAITMLALAQGIFMAIALRVSNSIAAADENVEVFTGLFERNYFFAAFTLSSLAFLTLLPLLFMFKRSAADVPTALVCQTVGSMVFPALFSIKMYRLMAVPPADPVADGKG